MEYTGRSCLRHPLGRGLPPGYAPIYQRRVRQYTGPLNQELARGVLRQQLQTVDPGESQIRPEECIQIPTKHSPRSLNTGTKIIRVTPTILKKHCRHNFYANSVSYNKFQMLFFNFNNFLVRA